MFSAWFTFLCLGYVEILTGKKCVWFIKQVFLPWEVAIRICWKSDAKQADDLGPCETEARSPGAVSAPRCLPCAMLCFLWWKRPVALPAVLCCPGWAKLPWVLSSSFFILRLVCDRPPFYFECPAWAFLVFCSWVFLMCVFFSCSAWPILEFWTAFSCCFPSRELCLKIFLVLIIPSWLHPMPFPFKFLWFPLYFSLSFLSDSHFVSLPFSSLFLHCYLLISIFSSFTGCLSLFLKPLSLPTLFPV